MRPNREKEAFFVSLVRCGVLSVGSDGVVRNLKTGRVTGKKSAARYCSVSMKREGKTLSMLVHRLVFLVHHGEIPDGFEVNHEDGVKTNNAADNLELLTQGQNEKHAYQIGLKSAKGERNGQSKLTDVQALEIRRKFMDGASMNELAFQYGVHSVTIYGVVRNRTYRHLNQD